MELRSLYEHLQARILEMIESLDELRASAEMEIFREVEQDESVIERIAAAQREELEGEIAELRAEAERVAEEARELVGEVPSVGFFIRAANETSALPGCGGSAGTGG